MGAFIIRTIAAHNNKGVALCKLGDLHRTRDAPTAADEALAGAPDHVVPLRNKGEQLRRRAEVHIEQGRPANACRGLHEARTLLGRAITPGAE